MVLSSPCFLPGCNIPFETAASSAAYMPVCKTMKKRNNDFYKQITIYKKTLCLDAMHSRRPGPQMQAGRGGGGQAVHSLSGNPYAPKENLAQNTL